MIDEIKFEFVKGELARIETFLLIKLLQHVLIIIDEIIKSPEVLALATPIKDLRNIILEPLTPEDFSN